MARTTITAQQPKGPYVSLQPAADSLDITMTAADVANKNQTLLAGQLLLIAQNTHATTAFTITITSIADSKLRTGDITTYTMQAGDISAFLISSTEGWLQADGYLYYEASNASVKFAVLKLS
jgi:hypothetical protein